MKHERRVARQTALKFLYQKEFESVQTAGMQSFLDSFFKKENCSEAGRDFCLKLLSGLSEKKPIIDQKISVHSKNWRIDRMSLMDLNIMRIAVFEILYKPDIPKKVSINEALELAKIFSGKKSPAFINGVLDSVLKEFLSSKQQKSAAEKS